MIGDHVCDPNKRMGLSSLYREFVKPREFFFGSVLYKNASVGLYRPSLTYVGVVF